MLISKWKAQTNIPKTVFQLEVLGLHSGNIAYFCIETVINSFENNHCSWVRTLLTSSNSQCSIAVFKMVTSEKSYHAHVEILLCQLRRSWDVLSWLMIVLFGILLCWLLKNPGFISPPGWRHQQKPGDVWLSEVNLTAPQWVTLTSEGGIQLQTTSLLPDSLISWFLSPSMGMGWP